MSSKQGRPDHTSQNVMSDLGLDSFLSLPVNMEYVVEVWGGGEWEAKEEWEGRM